MRLSTSLAAWVVVAGCAPRADWKPLAPSDAPFQVEMPAVWTEKSLDADGSRQYEARLAGAEFGVVLHRTPAGGLPPDQAKAVMESIRDAAAGGLAGGRVVESKDTSLDGRPGIEFRIEGSDGTVLRTRMYHAEPYLCSVAVSYRNQPAMPADLERFLESFHLKSSGGTAGAATPAGVTNPPPQVTDAANDDRRIWYFTDAPRVFPDQSGFTGIFRQEGKNWYGHSGVTSHDYIESARTADYIEIARTVGDFRVRLHADKSEYKFGRMPTFAPMFPGRWAKPAPLPKPANGAAEARPTVADADRIVWTFENVPRVFPDQAGTFGAYFRDGATWRGACGMQMLDFTESARAADSIELRRPDGFALRLFADHAEYRRNDGDSWHGMFDGGWRR